MGAPSVSGWAGQPRATPPCPGHTWHSFICCSVTTASTASIPSVTLRIFFSILGAALAPSAALSVSMPSAARRKGSIPLIAQRASLPWNPRLPGDTKWSKVDTGATAQRCAPSPGATNYQSIPSRSMARTGGGLALRGSSRLLGTRRLVVGLGDVRLHHLQPTTARNSRYSHTPGTPVRLNSVSQWQAFSTHLHHVLFVEQRRVDRDYPARVGLDRQL
jgi:hypothetical protein